MTNCLRILIPAVYLELVFLGKEVVQILLDVWIRVQNCISTRIKLSLAFIYIFLGVVEIKRSGLNTLRRQFFLPTSTHPRPLHPVICHFHLIVTATHPLVGNSIFLRPSLALLVVLSSFIYLVTLPCSYRSTFIYFKF